MVVLLILLFLVLSIVTYVFFAPFYLEVNTESGLYRMRFHRLTSVSLKLIDNVPIAEIRLAGWKKQIDLSAMSSPQTPKEKKAFAGNKKTRNIPWKKIPGLFKGFQIRKCRVTIDTGDMQLNGMLYPLFYLIGFYGHRDISINFMNENTIILEIKSSLARMSWAY
ncbi:MAG TPA: hypothetical protein VGO45_08575, partial [Bacteroidia bacterium]|nr:hypothetical protein [Bacteroidia bacterium]